MRNESTAASLVLFEQLSPEVRRELGPQKIRTITGNILAAEKNRQLYQDMWGLIKKHKAWKRQHGFCSGGDPVCMEKVQDSPEHERSIRAGRATEHTCSKCLAIFARRRNNPSKRQIQRSPYGQWRMVQRAQEKAERARLGK